MADVSGWALTDTDRRDLADAISLRFPTPRSRDSLEAGEFTLQWWAHRLRARNETPRVDVVAAVRRDSTGRVWLCKRNSDGAHAGLKGLWEYPGGKVEPNEQLRDALIRELKEEFPGSSPVIGQVLDSIESTYEGTTYRVTFFAVEMNEPTEHPTHSEVRWMTPGEACEADHLPSGTVFNARHLAPLVPSR